ncbi:MAG: FtsX-like permease family protein [Chloroflexia bacterium]|nr:FtsX-like permease family protein [Chloroflexia bacterium]
MNEEAVKLLGADDCIGKTIRRDRIDYEIIGVVKNFHFNSKHRKIGPLGLVQIPDAIEFWSPLYCSVAVRTNNSKEAMTGIEKVWKELAPGNEFSYAFLIRNMTIYTGRKCKQTSVFIFSIIAIVLSCFGLFGFVKYTIQVRTKEIGIRKVNGAKSNSIFVMLSRYFTRPVVIALIISFPIAWFAIDSWLQNFAYRIKITPVYFILAGVLTIAIVFLTVGWLSWKAARRNPVEALRYE